MLRALVVLVLLSVSVLAAPGATAAFRMSDAADVAGTLHIPQDDPQSGSGFHLLSGALTYQERVRGPVFVMDTGHETRLGAETIRVFRTDDPAAYAQRTPAFVASSAELVPDRGGSFFWSLPDANVSGATPYAFTFLVQLEAGLGDSFLLPDRDGPPPVSLVTQAPDPWSFDATGTERSLFLPLSGGFRVTDANGTSRSFDGHDWLVSLVGPTQAGIAATGLAVPFAAGARAEIRQASADTFAARFSVEDLQAFLDLAATLSEGFDPPQEPLIPDDQTCTDPRLCPDGKLRTDWRDLVTKQAPGGNGTPEAETGPAPDATIPPEAAEALAALAPLLNGALFGQPDGTIRIADDDATTPGFSLVRFTRLDLVAADHERVALHGTAPFAFTGGAVHHDAGILRLGPFVLPVLSIALYLIAAGAWAASRAWTARPADDDLTLRLALGARVTQWGLLVVAFALFDREVHYILGQSLLGSLGLYGSAAVAMLPTPSMALSGNILMIVLQLGFWAAASAAFGLPVAIIGRAALRVAGLGKATNGFAIGLGALATWLLGTAMILPILDVAFGQIAGAA